MVKSTRRELIAGTAGMVAVGALSGCLSGSGATAGTTAQASFHIFGDFAAEVAGETATAETLVPLGQHGHGWEPGPRVQGDVLEADLFVHGMEGFQPWADDIAASVQSDGAGVTPVSAAEGIDRHDPGEHGQHEEAERDGHHQEEGRDDHHEETTHTGHHEADHTDHEGGGGHDHSGREDPHFWLDPMRAKLAVDNIEAGFARVDGENADVYAANAESYRSTLDDLHDTVQQSLETASKDAIFVAGHDAFGYLGARYGFQVETLTGVSPDDSPTPRDIEAAQRLIDEHDIEYVCADPLESQQAATQLVAETDATDVLPLTSIPGQTEAWAEKGWGYVEVMTNVNLPTLAAALDAR